MSVTWAEKESLLVMVAVDNFFRKTQGIAEVYGLSVEALTALRRLRSRLNLVVHEGNVAELRAKIVAAEAGTSSGRTAPAAVRGTPGPSYDRGPRHVWAMLQR
jgi:hypothetical protein